MEKNKPVITIELQNIYKTALCFSFSLPSGHIQHSIHWRNKDQHRTAALPHVFSFPPSSVMLHRRPPCGSYENPFFFFFLQSFFVSVFTLSGMSGWKRREGESERRRSSHSLQSASPSSKGSQADILGVDAALMTGLGAWDTGPTGDLQVLLEEPQTDSHPLRVGLKL